jgi:lysophospholipase L1-like esterase
MRTIVCYGDSNTHGTSPVDQARFGRDVRWPGVLRGELGEGHEVIEEGLGGRTTVWDTPWSPARNGREMIQPILWTHAPVDLVTIMLGTNDLKGFFGLTAAEIANGAGALVDLAHRSLAGPGDTPPRVLLIAPPPLAPATAKSEMWGFDRGLEASRHLGRHYALVAEMKGVAFLDAGSVIETSALDGVHFDERAHALLGSAVAARIREMFDAG